MTSKSQFLARRILQEYPLSPSKFIAFHFQTPIVLFEQVYTMRLFDAALETSLSSWILAALFLLGFYVSHVMQCS